MPLPFPQCAAADRAQSVALNRRRGARATQVVAFPGRRTPESAYNHAGVAGQALPASPRL
jgi:hypothetical protein